MLQTVCALLPFYVRTYAEVRGSNRRAHFLSQHFPIMGKSSKRKSRPPQQQHQQQLPAMMPMMPPQYAYPQPQMPMMPPQFAYPQPQPQQEAPEDNADSESESDDEEPKSKYTKSEEAVLTRSATFFGKLPKSRLLDALEAVDVRNDPAMTSSISDHMRPNALWLFTKVRPNVKVADSRDKTYKALNKRLIVANQRVKKTMGEHAYNALVDKLIHAEMNGDTIMEVANAHNFNQCWLDDVFKKKRKQGQQQGIVRNNGRRA